LKLREDKRKLISAIKLTTSK